MSNVPLEESTTDFSLYIYDADWDNQTDNDNDDFYSAQDLVVDVDISDGSTAEIFLEIYHAVAYQLSLIVSIAFSACVTLAFAEGYYWRSNFRKLS